VIGPFSPPWCFGKKYDNDNPTCNACSFRDACRDVLMIEATKMEFPRYAVPIPPALVQQPQLVQMPMMMPQQMIPYAQPQVAPQPWHIAQPRPFQPSPQMRVPVPQMMMQMPQQMQMQVPQPQPQFQFQGLGWYGAIPDPMWGAIAMVPPIMRPQMQGEGFISRFAKNLFAVGIEMLGREVMLAARQLIFAPGREEIDVTPQA
jgi:hypothetical protein